MNNLEENEYGLINIKPDVIAKVAGFSTIECYGVIGMSSQQRIKDEVFELLKKENASRGVKVREDDGGIHVDINIIVMYGVKISEVSRNIQEKVSYDLKQGLGIPITSINVIVNGVQYEK